MISFDDFRRFAGEIPYQYRHPEFLYALVKWLRPINVVEVGTHIGMSAVWLARALQEIGGGRLWCIDNFCWVNERQEEQWYANVEKCRVQDVITLLKGRSQEVTWPEKVGMAFIDGNHTYEVCKYDVYEAVARGAMCIAMHDTVSWEGSRKLAEEIYTSWSPGWDILDVVFDDGLLVAIKREAKGECRGQDIGEQWDKPT